MGLKDDNINLQINIGVSGAAANIQKLNDENTGFFHEGC